MTQEPRGKCRHGEFILTEGCPYCIAEQRGDWQSQIEETQRGGYLRARGVAPRKPGAPLAEVIIRQLRDAQLRDAQEPNETTAVIKIAPEHDPAVLALANEARKLLHFAGTRVIANDGDLKPATDDLSIIAKLKKALSEKKADYLKPIKAHIDAVNAAFTSIMAPLDEADLITRNKVKDYRAEIDKRRLEAEAINRQKEELARREAAFNGTGEVTIDTTLVEVPAPISRIVTDLGAVGTMKVYKWEVVDIALVPREYLVVNAGMVTGVVKGSKGKIVIPGLRIWQEETLKITAK